MGKRKKRKRNVGTIIMIIVIVLLSVFVYLLATKKIDFSNKNDDLVKDNIYTLIEYKKRADQRKSTNIPNKSIPQNKKKDTNKKDEIKVLDNKFNNGSNQTFTKYTPEELEKLLQENQKRKFN